MGGVSLKSAEYSREVLAEKDGYIFSMNAEIIGISALELGAGRRSKDDLIDYTAGIVLKKKTGELVKKGDVLATLYSSRSDTLSAAEAIFRDSLSFSDSAPAKTLLIHKTIE